MDEQKEPQAPVINDDLRNVVIVDNLPVTTKDKVSKLGDVLRNRLVTAIKDYHPNPSVVDVHMPLDDANKTLGYCFVELDSVASAEALLALHRRVVDYGEEKSEDKDKERNKLALDKSHRLSIISYVDFDRIVNLPDVIEPVSVPEASIPSIGYQLDTRARDQFIVRSMEKTDIYWNDPSRFANDFGRQLVHPVRKEHLAAYWSPNGTYLLAYHKAGVILMSGDELTSFNMEMADVQHHHFSPNEKYLILAHRAQTWMSGIENHHVLDAPSFNARVIGKLRRNEAIVELGMAWDHESGQLFVKHDRGFTAVTNHHGAPCLIADRSIPSPKFRLVVWDIKKRQKLYDSQKSTGARALSGAAAATRARFDQLTESGMFRWPILKFSHDDTYAAAIEQDRIGIFRLPGLDAVNAIKVDRVQEVQWSPSANILSYSVPELESRPATEESPAVEGKPCTVALVEIPSMKTLRDRHPVSVADIRMVWQDRGDYLAVVMTKHPKKKVLSTVFELFRTKEKDCPLETFEIADNFVSLDFEAGGGNRFSVVHVPEKAVIDLNRPLGDKSPAPRSLGKPVVSFYQMQTKALKPIGKLENREVNHVVWAPSGAFCVLVHQKSGQLEFIDASLTRVPTLDTVGLAQHNNLTHQMWDSTGRYFLTANCQIAGMASTMQHNAYKIFAREGHQLYHVPVDDLQQVAWRPHPPPLLAAEQMAALRRTAREHVLGDRIVVPENAIAASATLVDVKKKGDNKKTRTASTNEPEAPAAPASAAASAVPRIPLWKLFEKQDKEDEVNQQSEEARERNELRHKWEKLRARQSKIFASEEQARRTLLGLAAEDEENDWIDDEQIVEEELTRDEEEIALPDQDEGDDDDYGDEGLYDGPDYGPSDPRYHQSAASP